MYNYKYTGRTSPGQLMSNLLPMQIYVCSDPYFLILNRPDDKITQKLKIYFYLTF